MVGKIECTYENCYRRFDSVESMKKHKAKDPAHCDFYCNKCDEDCNDDTEYLIHQIISPKHSRSFLHELRDTADHVQSPVHFVA